MALAPLLVFSCGSEARPSPMPDPALPFGGAGGAPVGNAGGTSGAWSVGGASGLFGGSGGQTGGQAASGGGGPVGGASGASVGGTGAAAGAGGSAATDPNADLDQDSFSPAQGDCNDAEPLINPGAYDFPENGIDEDCDKRDATLNESVCDASLAIDSADAKDGARAIGLCRFAAKSSRLWGVISAAYTDAGGNGTPSNRLQTGILPAFGPLTPHEGRRILALSSGVARAPNQAGYTADCDMFSDTPTVPPLGYPKEPPSCKGSSFGWVVIPAPYDAVALSLEIRVPTNAKTLIFESNFYTYEYPDFVCSPFNDFFVVMMDPILANLPDGNIAFDQDGNPISVNNSFLRVCEAGTHNGRTFACPLGTANLVGTGYDGASTCSDKRSGSTGWLVTAVPVTGGNIIKLRFAIWDTGDSTLDSTVLVDNFRWSINPASKPGTIPLE